MSQTDIGTENSLGPPGTWSSVLRSNHNRGIYFLKEISEHLFHKSRELTCDSDSEGIK